MRGALTVVGAGLEVTIRGLDTGEAAAVHGLVMRSFETFVARDFTPEGVAEFARYANPEALLERTRSEHSTLVAVFAGQVVGMIELRHDEHLSMLFVEGSFHGRGIARRLVEAAIDRARTEEPGLTRVTVNSSRFAVPAYERLGFRVTGPETTADGVVFVPMAAELHAAAD